MNTQKVVRFRRGNHRRLRRLIIGATSCAVIVLAAMFIIGKLTADSEEYRQKVSLVEENRVLREQVSVLSERVAELEGTVSAQESYIASLPQADTAQPNADSAQSALPTEAPAAANGFTAASPRSMPGQ